MPTIISKSIGAAPGRDFSTLAAFASAIPADLVALDQLWVGEMWFDGEDPGGASFAANCDAACKIILRAAPGEGFRDRFDPAATPLSALDASGAVVHAATGAAITIASAATRLEISGLRLIADAGAALAAPGLAPTVIAEDMLIDAASTQATFMIGGAAGIARNLALVQRGAGGGLRIAGAGLAKRCTALKPSGAPLASLGFSADGPGARASSCAAFGFARGFDAQIAAADADHLACDQENLIFAPSDFTDTSWSAVSANVSNPLDVIQSPDGIPLQLINNNGNRNFSRFTTASLIDIAPGETGALTATYAHPTAAIGGLAVFAGGGKMKIMIDWRTSLPTLQVAGANSVSELSSSIEEVAPDIWRIRVDFENDTAASLSIGAQVNVTASSANGGLPAQMYAGGIMLSVGYASTAFVGPGHPPGTFALTGVDPALALVSPSAGAPDLRATPDGPIDGSGASGGSDIIGAVSPGAGPIGPWAPGGHPSSSPSFSQIAHGLTDVAVTATTGGGGVTASPTGPTSAQTLGLAVISSAQVPAFSVIPTAMSAAQELSAALASASEPPSSLVSPAGLSAGQFLPAAAAIGSLAPFAAPAKLASGHILPSASLASIFVPIFTTAARNCGLGHFLSAAQLSDSVTAPSRAPLTRTHVAPPRQ